MPAKYFLHFDVYGRKLLLDHSKNISKQIKVKNTLEFLTRASSILRENSQCKVIAITGSCGKTSVKELIGKTLRKFSNVTYSPKSFNNKYGVPLSLFNLKQNDKFGVFEVGMDKKGEIDNLTKIIKPEIFGFYHIHVLIKKLIKRHLD